jgi:PadR family transcriptional regulator PadR
VKGWVAQVRKGLVELCVMAALERSEAYGAELLQRLTRADGLAITESTVYPILARLTEDGLLAVRAAPSPAGPPRRYYRLTSLGRARLREMTAYWNDIRASVEALTNGIGKGDKR